MMSSSSFSSRAKLIFFLATLGLSPSLSVDPHPLGWFPGR